MKKTIIFTLKAIISESKRSQIDNNITDLIFKLISDGNNVGILDCNSWNTLSKKVVPKLNPKDNSILNSLYFLPSNGSSIYQTWGNYGWIPAFQSKLNKEHINKITAALKSAIIESGYQSSENLQGKELDITKDGLVSFYVFGKNNPYGIDKVVDKDNVKKLLSNLRSKLEDFEVYHSNFKSIHIAPKNVNKKNAIDELMKRLHISKDDVVFVGTSLSSSSDEDYFAVEMGLDNKIVDKNTTIQNIINELM